MAKKMYYTEEEAAKKLGVSLDELNLKFVREGKLRGFQDGSKKMYKAADVDAIAPEEEIQLSPGSDDTARLSQADEARPAGKEDTVITSEGISIFDSEDLEVDTADPLAKTTIAPGLEDQIQMEGVGSGSGLLDLTRESDDTSLGAEVLDHIDAEEAQVQAEPEPVAPIMSDAMEMRVVEAPDPNAGLFSGFAIAGMVIMIVVTLATIPTMMGVLPGFVESLKENVVGLLIGCLLLAIICGVVGMLLSRQTAARQAAIRRM